MFALLAAVILVAPAAHSAGPAFIENDYAKALAKAKSTKKLLFVDATAAWCHSCVYMREHVLNQPELVAFEKDIVFASIDTELAGSAAFLEKYPIKVWPTLLFIDPATESVRFRWAGSADAAQLAALLAAAQRRDEKVVDADAAYANGDATGAAEKFMAARKAGDDSARATMSLLGALTEAGQHELCAKTATEDGPTLAARSDQLFAAVSAFSCALDVREGTDGREALVKTSMAQVKALIAKPDGLMGDDVSSAYELLVSERDAAKDEAGSVALAKEWQAFLDSAAAKAKTNGARAAFDAHRVLAALASKQPDHMIEPLLLSERQFPKDYNPPARLASAYTAAARNR